ncbi:MAG: DUF928 domain-containing protein [Nitrospirales bacterium]|nr:DUF928 domain-containing protein [Nitrospirales bacterium]
MKRDLAKIILGFGFLLLVTSPCLATQPNIVLSRALHFPAPDGSSVLLSPGKYFIEQSGSTELRLMPEGAQPGSGQVIHAQALTHEQYELFSPMALTRPQKNDEYLIELLMPGGIRLEARGSTQPPIPPTLPVSASELSPSPKIAPLPTPIVPEPPITASPLPIQETEHASLPVAPPTPVITSTPSLPYQAPSLSSQGKRIIVDRQEMGQEPIFLAVLSPDHIGLTIFEQPALFWFIGTPTDHPVDVMITDENNTQLLLDVRMLPPIRPGIHKVELKDYGIKLQPNTTYQWKIMLQGVTQGESLVTSGWIMRVNPPSHLITIPDQPTMQTAPLEQLVEAGLWYDAFWALSERIQSDGLNGPYLNQRASLLEQVGLLPPAELDRSHKLSP